jgi:hypothetical protein
MEEDGYITPVHQPTEWVSSMVKFGSESTLKTLTSQYSTNIIQ